MESTTRTDKNAVFQLKKVKSRHMDYYHLPIQEGWRAKLAWLADSQRKVYP